MRYRLWGINLACSHNLRAKTEALRCPSEQLLMPLNKLQGTAQATTSVFNIASGVSGTISYT